MRWVMIIIGGILIALVVLIGVFVAATWAPELSLEELQPRWGEPPSVFIDVAGMKVHLRDEGPREDATPIVLLHGTASSLHTWQGWAEALRGERRVIRYDLAGFGLTGPSPDHLYGIDHDIRLLIAILDRLGVERCIIGGNSLGGSVAWRAALSYPARVEKLILVDSGGYPSRSSAVPIGFRLARLPAVNLLLKNSLPRSIVEQGLHQAFGDPANATPELVQRYYELMRRDGNREALFERARQRPRATVEHRIPELKLPALILWGGRDRLIPPENARRFHHDIAGSRLVMFDELGHVPQEEDPARTVLPVQQFLGLQ